MDSVMWGILAAAVVIVLFLTLGLILGYILRSNSDLQRQMQAPPPRTVQVHNLVIKSHHETARKLSCTENLTGPNRKRIIRKSSDKATKPIANENFETDRVDREQFERDNKANIRKRISVSRLDPAESERFSHQRADFKKYHDFVSGFPKKYSKKNKQIAKGKNVDIRKLVSLKRCSDTQYPTRGVMSFHQGSYSNNSIVLDSGFLQENEKEVVTDIVQDMHKRLEHLNRQNISSVIDEFTDQPIEDHTRVSTDCDSAMGSSVDLSSETRSNFDEHSVRSDIEVHEVKSARESRTITVGKEGCKFIAPYAKVDFPANCVAHPIQIEVTPRYECQGILEGKMMITPTVDFHSTDEMAFLKNVRVHLYTPYSASTRGKAVAVEVMRMEQNSGSFKPFTRAELDQDCWVSFWCLHFCRLCGAVSHADRPRTKKRYYSAGIVRDTTQHVHRAVSWMICEDMPNVKEINEVYFKAQDRRKVIDAESFEVGYEYNLRLKLESKGKMPNSSQSEAEAALGCEINLRRNLIELPLHQRYGTGFDEKSVFFLSTGAEESFFLALGYKIYAISIDGDMQNREIFDKETYLDWSTTERPSLHINASGPHSTGIKLDMHGDTSRSRHQTSGYQTDHRNVGLLSDSAAPSIASRINDSLEARPLPDGSFQQQLPIQEWVGASAEIPNPMALINDVGQVLGEESKITEAQRQIESLGAMDAERAIRVSSEEDESNSASDDIQIGNATQPKMIESQNESFNTNGASNGNRGFQA